MLDKSPKSAKLRREAFARHFIILREGKAAAIAAGFSPATAEVRASQLLRHADVKAMVERLEREANERLEITKDKVNKEIASVAFADLREFYDDEGAILPPKKWTKEMAAAVKGVSSVEIYEGEGEDRKLVGYVKKIMLWDRLGANTILGAPFGIGVKKMEVGNPGDFEGKHDIDEIKKRIKEKSARNGVVVRFPGRDRS